MLKKIIHGMIPKKKNLQITKSLKKNFTQSNFKYKFNYG